MSLEKLKFSRDVSKTKKTKIDTKQVNAVDGNNSGIFDIVGAGKKLVAGISNFVSGEKLDETTSFEEHSGHKLDDRVWVYIQDKAQCGIIKYIGRIPKEGDQIFAGILLVGYN